METWEYRTFSCAWDLVNEILAESGSKGWELVSLLPKQWNGPEYEPDLPEEYRDMRHVSVVAGVFKRRKPTE
jgi:hypothetical protein